MAVFIFPDVSDEFTRKVAAATVAVNEGKKGSIRFLSRSLQAPEKLISTAE